MHDLNRVAEIFFTGLIEGFEPSDDLTGLMKDWVDTATRKMLQEPSYMKEKFFMMQAVMGYPLTDKAKAMLKAEPQLSLYIVQRYTRSLVTEAMERKRNEISKSV